MALSLRTFLLWMLMLAVPVQGLAAATMSLCVSQQQPAVASQVGLTMPCAEGHHGHHSAATPDLDKKCSACAACHAVGALLNELPTLVLPNASLTMMATPLPSITHVIADGLDRPPRSTLV
jgi:hypothetical protein